MAAETQGLFRRVLALHDDIRTPFEDIKACCADAWSAVSQEVEATFEHGEAPAAETTTDKSKGKKSSGPKGKKGVKRLQQKEQGGQGTKIQRGSLVVSKGMTKSLTNFSKAMASNISVLLDLTEALDDVESHAAANPGSMSAETRASACFLRRFYGQLLPMHVQVAQVLFEMMKKPKLGGKIPPVQAGFMDPQSKVQSDCSDHCSECNTCKDCPSSNTPKTKKRIPKFKGNHPE